MTPPAAVPDLARRGFLRRGLLLPFAILLAGCGRKGPPQPPGGKSSRYPRQYPPAPVSGAAVSPPPALPEPQ